MPDNVTKVAECFDAHGNVRTLVVIKDLGQTEAQGPKPAKRLTGAALGKLRNRLGESETYTEEVREPETFTREDGTEVIGTVVERKCAVVTGRISPKLLAEHTAKAKAAAAAAKR